MSSLLRLRLFKCPHYQFLPQGVRESRVTAARQLESRTAPSPVCIVRTEGYIFFKLLLSSYERASDKSL